jgi:hypothetical protein
MMEKKMTRSLALALGLLALTPAVTLAAPFCTDDAPGVHFSMGFSIGGKYTETERNDFDMMQLRQLGVDVTRVERWNGCIRAFVRKPTGGEEMQFFQPNSYERVY